MSAPLIGLTTRNIEDPKYGFPLFSAPKTYSQALIRAGAIPVLLPVNLPPNTYPELLNRLDGILFSGGGDIDLNYFQGEPHEKIYGIDLERDEFELSLARYAAKQEIPFLGICRGFQVVNVAMGGTLYTHIYDQLPGALQHDCFPEFPPSHISHPVEVKSGSLLNELIGTTHIKVNSLHHQGARTLAAGLELVATAPDGLVEAFQLPSHPFGIAVQWHPEWMPDVPEMKAIFKGFVHQARKYQAARN
jgi:putative glutamine amidotransferase